MQSGLSPTVSANAIHPIEIQSDDPRNLNNLTARIVSLNSQSSADTKYDPTPPSRVDKNGNPVNEAFVATLDIQDTKIYGDVLYALGALSLIILIMVIFTYLDPKLYMSISQIKNGKLFIVLAGFISLLSIGMSVYGLKVNEVIQWYPKIKNARIIY